MSTEQQVLSISGIVSIIFIDLGKIVLKRSMCFFQFQRSRISLACRYPKLDSIFTV